MSSPIAQHRLRYRPSLEPLEDRILPAVAFPFEPVVPTIDAVDRQVLGEVLQRGIALGNRLNVFAKVGDSLTFAPEFLTPLGLPSYNLFNPAIGGGYGYLGNTLGVFQSGLIGVQNSFLRTSFAAFPGYTSLQALQLLTTELSLARPAFALVMVGTNDMVLNVPPEEFRARLLTLVRTSMNMGVVPVLSTLPDLLLAPHFGPAGAVYNQVIAEVADETHAPLWNYWRALQSAPLVGISLDRVHPTAFPGGTGVFTDVGLLFGYNLRNLTALQTLHKLMYVLLQGGPADLPGGSLAWAPLSGTLVASAGGQSGFQVEVIDPAARVVLFRFNPYPGFNGGVRTALGDINGDGVPDLITVPGPGAPAHVKVFDGVSGTLVSSFLAHAPGMLLGINVAAGDLDGDGLAEILTGVEPGGPAHIKVFTASGTSIASFYAFAPSFLGGARVAAGDVDGGRADVIVAAGPGGRGHVRVFSGDSLTEIASFLPYGASFLGAVALAAGDVDGDGRSEIATAVESGGPPHVKVFTGLGDLLASFFTFSPIFGGGVHIGIADFNADGRDDLIATPASSSAPHIRVVDVLSQQDLDSFFAFSLISSRGAFLDGDR